MTKNNETGGITIGGQTDFWDGVIDYDGPNVIGSSRCYETHPPLSVGGGTLLGGNCRDHKRHTGVALYVALDGSMQHPFFEVGADLPVSVYYPITNMSVPKNPDKFLHLVDTITAFLKQGKTVHVGCIGGHGRTGLVLAAVVARVGGITNDPIKWVRENYCHRAIESARQEGYLATHFGCPLPPAKSKVDKRRRGR